MIIISFDVADPQISNITRWHGLLMSQEVFRDSDSVVTGGKGISGLKVKIRQKIGQWKNCWYLHVTVDH